MISSPPTGCLPSLPIFPSKTCGRALGEWFKKQAEFRAEIEGPEPLIARLFRLIYFKLKKIKMRQLMEKMMMMFQLSYLP